MTQKILLLSALLATGSFCLNAKNGCIENVYATRISPDGHYLSGDNDAEFIIIDIEDGTSWSYNAEDGYSGGIGNCWSREGVMAGNTKENIPAIWKDGKWTPLKTLDKNRTHILRGITPDGKRICGTIGMPRPAGDVEDYLISGPAIWELQEDGNYGEPILLPHPEIDFTNRVPQYVTANNISDDGKTIAGQIVDGRGFLTMPIVYHLQDDGSWEYETVGESLINPLKVEFPEYPGAGPTQPMAENYLTAEEKAAYDEALAQWVEEGSDYNTEPWPDQFLGAESKAAYEKDFAEFTKEQEEWEKVFLKWVNAYEKCAQKGCNFVFNDIFLSPDGKLLGLNDKHDYNNNTDIMLAPSKISPQDGNGASKYTPVVIDLTDGNSKRYETELYNGIQMTGISADGTILGVNEPQPYPEAYLYLKGEGEPVKLIDYIKGISEATANWMLANMTHDVEVYDPENDNYELVSGVFISGIPAATPDLQTIVTTAYAIWTATGAPYLTYVITPSDPDMVENIGTDESEISITLDSCGSLQLSEASDVRIYDLTGALCYEAKGMKSAYTALPRGLYIVRATTADGRTATKKTVI